MKSTKHYDVCVRNRWCHSQIVISLGISWFPQKFIDVFRTTPDVCSVLDIVVVCCRLLFCWLLGIFDQLDSRSSLLSLSPREETKRTHNTTQQPSHTTKMPNAATQTNKCKSEKKHCVIENNAYVINSICVH